MNDFPNPEDPPVRMTVEMVSMALEKEVMTGFAMKNPLSISRRLETPLVPRST